MSRPSETLVYDETTPPAQLLARIAELEAQLAAARAAAQQPTASAPEPPAPHAAGQPAEADLRAGELRLRLALAAANMVAWEWDLLHSTMIWIADPSQHFNLAGQEPGQLSVAWRRFIPPEDLADLRKALGAAPLHSDVRLEHRYYRDDGSLGWVETLVRIAAQHNNLPSRLVGVSIEISRHKELEAALRRREQQFSTLVENLPNVIFRYRVRPDHAYEYVSPAALRVTGYPPEAFYADAQMMTRLTHPDDRPLLQAIDPQAPDDTPVPTHLIHRFYHKDGSLRWIELISTPIRNDAGQIVAYDGILYDITAYKQLEQTLRAQNRMQEALAGALHALHSHAHEPIARRRIFTATAMQLCLGVAAEHVLIWEWSADEVQLVTAADSVGRLRPEEWRLALHDLPAVVQQHFAVPEAVAESVGVPAFADRMGAVGGYYLLPVHWPEVHWGFVAVGVAAGYRLGQAELNLLATVIEMLRTTIRRWQAVDALQASERNLRLALAAGQLSTWELDLTTQEIFFSARLAPLFGVPPSGGSLALSDLVARLHPEDRERGLVSMASVIEGYLSPGLEVRVIQPDGAIVWVRGRGQLLRNTLGMPERIVGVLADVTEERTARDVIARSNAELERRVAERTLELERANRDLSENRRFLERVLAASPSRVNIFDYASGRIIYSNGSFTTLLGYTPEQLAALGGPYPLAQLIHPDDLALVPAQVQRQRTMADDEVLEREFRMRHADGSWRWFVTYDVVFARDDQGAPVQILGQVTEITGRKQIEAALKDAYTQLEALNAELQHNSGLLHTIINSLSDSLALIDGDGRLVMVNRSLGALCGVAPDAVVGRDWRTLGVFQSSALLEQAISAGLNFSGREQLLCRGEARVFEVQVFPLPNPQIGRQVVVRLVDVTEQLQVQAVLIQNERLAATGRLAAVVAHEVNSPLQAIQNFLFLAASDDPAERTAYLTMVANEIDRIGGLIRRLLDLQRPDAAAVRPIELHGVIAQVLTLIGGTLLRNRVRVTNELDHEPIWVIGRSDEFAQVLFNLFVNAIDAMPHGGALTVASQRRPPHSADGFASPLPAWIAQIDIIDTGPGIPANLISRVFEPFYTTKPGGSGLGLAISRQIVEQHGGRLTAANAHPVGAVFRMVLPLSEPDLN